MISMMSRKIGHEQSPAAVKDDLSREREYLSDMAVAEKRIVSISELLYEE